MASDTLMALCTCPDEAVARDLATALVEARLAACVNVLPGIGSVYRWQGEVESATEVLLIMKTTTACWDRLVAAVTAQHPYELPELIAVPVSNGLTPYLNWIRESTA